MRWYYMTIHFLGDSMNESILGANEEDALRSAFQTWPEALDIQPIEGGN
jgi:hypothetical protein